MTGMLNNFYFDFLLIQACICCAVTCGLSCPRFPNAPPAPYELLQATVVALSSRLLLQALVTVPSSGGVVEELLATAAVSPQSDLPNKTRAVGLASDVLSLVASGDISLSKVQSPNLLSNLAFRWLFLV